MSIESVFFIILGIVGIAAAIVTITAKNPVISAVGLIVHFFMLAGLYLTLHAQFLAVLQIMVYAGAIMVLVIFVIMLLNLGDEEKLKEKLNLRSTVAIAFAIVLLTQFVILFIVSNGSKSLDKTTSVGTVQTIGNELFTNYLFPFEAISLLLLVAIIGSVILAKRNID